MIVVFHTFFNINQYIDLYFYFNPEITPVIERQSKFPNSFTECQVRHIKEKARKKLVKNKTQLFSNFFTNTLSYIIMKIQYNNPYYILFIDTLYIQKDCSKSLQPNSASLSF